MKLNILRDKAYQCALKHGWHEEEHSNEHCLCLVISELMEAVEADRRNRHARVDYYKERIANSRICRGLDAEISKETGYMAAFDEAIKDTVEDELADACIRLLDFAGVVNANLDDIDYEHSSTEDYSELSFTESMFKIVRVIEHYFDPMDIAFILNEIFAFCNSRDIDIFWHIEQKMKFNELRPYKHGDKKY